MARKSEHADVVVHCACHSKSTESIYKIVGLFSKKILFVNSAFIRGFDGNRWNIQSVTSRPIVWLTSLSTTKWTPSWTFRSFIYYTFSAHIYIFAYFMFLFLNFIIFTQMFSMQFDVSSERSQSQNDMTETKAKFVGCWLAGWLVGWCRSENTKKNIQKKLCWNCPLESPAIFMQYSTEYDWCKHTNIAGVLETKSQKPDTHRENGTHDGNNFPFNFSTNLVRTCNLDAYHRYTCMRKWSAQRAWNIKVNNSKQTLKTCTRMLHSQSCWHSTLFSLRFDLFFAAVGLCVNVHLRRTNVLWYDVFILQQGVEPRLTNVRRYVYLVFKFLLCVDQTLPKALQNHIGKHKISKWQSNSHSNPNFQSHFFGNMIEWVME